MDGVVMLLRYISSYVTKWQDGTSIDSLYFYKLQGCQAAIRYLISNKAAEPEMWLFMSSKKLHGLTVEESAIMCLPKKN